MDDITKRGREWNDSQCDEFAAFDVSRDPKEFLSHIYREATNGDQHPDARIAKTLAKCSALFVRLSSDQERIARKVVGLTWALVVLTVPLLLLTGYLTYDVYRKGGRDPKPNEIAQEPNANVKSRSTRPTIGSKENPIPIPDGEVFKLKGRLSEYTPGIRPTLYVYNGTDWSVTDMDISITNKKSGEERKFRFFASDLDVKRNDQGKIIETGSKKVFISPLTEGTMDGSIGEFLTGVDSSSDWSWTPVAAYGFKD